MRCEEVREDAELYAVGALDTPERESLERHAASCSTCHEMLEAATMQAGRLGFSAPLHHAPPELYARIRHQLETDERANRHSFAPLRFVRPADTRQAPATLLTRAAPRFGDTRAARWRWATTLVASVAVAVAIGAGAWIVNLRLQVHRLVIRSQSLQRRMADMEGQRDAVMLLVADGTQRFAMQSTDSSTAAAGAVIWNPGQHKCSVFAAGLPAPPPDQAYHVWLMGGNHSWDEGELSAGEGGAAEKTIDLSLYSAQVNYQLVVSRQPRQSGSGEWQPLLRAWVGD
jgi:hypothetical protein